jgi:alpha-L-fucosidase 2
MDFTDLLCYYFPFPSLAALLATLRMWIHRGLLALSQFLLVVHCAPPGFPASGNGLWFTQPGVVWAKDWLPVGNGYLGGTYYTLAPRTA